MSIPWSVIFTIVVIFGIAGLFSWFLLYAFGHFDRDGVRLDNPFAVYHARLDRLRKENEWLQKENKRLRNALEQIAGNSSDRNRETADYIAIDALESWANLP
jgi:hypothetical protein